MIQDCLFALRTFRRNPLLAATAIICLTLGIGGTTAVFSVINGVLLEPLPYPNAERLVMLRTTQAEGGADEGRLSAAELRDWQRLAQSFEAIAGYRWMTIDLVDSDHSDRLQGLWVTPEFFSIFGIQASAGHVLRPDDPPGIVLGHSVWQRRFASNPSIVGQSISVGICCPQQPQTNRIPVAGAVDHDVKYPPTLPGIRDRGHGLNESIDYWFPLDVRRAKRPEHGPDGRTAEAIARLKPNVTLRQAQAEMDSIAAQLAKDFPNTNRGWTVRVVSVNDELFANVRPALLVLMAAAAFVLLIACANVAVLLTFHAVQRFHEVAIRTALGAPVRRLIGQSVIEAMILTSGGGAAGLLLAAAVRRVLVAVAPPGLPRIADISMDMRVFGFATAAAILCGVVIGLIPALRILKFDLEPTLRGENSRNATSHARARTYEPLIVVQVALTLSLLIGSGLMFKTLSRLFGVAPGFQAANVITTTVSLPSAKHAWSYNSRFIESVLDRVRQIPGVEAAGAIRGIPMNEVRFDERFWRWDRPPADVSRAPLGTIRVVSEEYFHAIGSPILSGRDFTRTDGVGEIGKTHAVIINEAMARLLWSGENSVGQKLACCELSNEGATIIGVVGDARYTALDRTPVPEVYYPEGLFPQDEFALVIRSAANSTPTAESIRTAIHDVEHDVFIGQFQSMETVIAQSAVQRRFMMLLLSIFSGTGVLLAITGITGVVAYSLSLRVTEVGIRVAMGATPVDVVALITRQGALPAFAGIVLGSVLSLGFTRFLSGMLFGVAPYDPVVFASAIAALSAVCILTAGLSAYRACLIDPVRILK
jgi:putative ABC transport system permease protein